MKKVLLLLSAIGLSCSVSAGVLYWQVTTETQNKYDYSSAYLFAVESDTTAATIVSSIGTTVRIDDSIGDGLAKGNSSIVTVNLDNYTSKSFYIELVKYDESSGNNTSVACSELMTYSQLTDYISTNSDPKKPWTGGAYSVPEPTSALLMLLGAAGLALKRPASCKRYAVTGKRV